jgi:hypothetical protein
LALATALRSSSKPISRPSSCFKFDPVSPSNHFWHLPKHGNQHQQQQPSLFQHSQLINQSSKPTRPSSRDHPASSMANVRHPFSHSTHGPSKRHTHSLSSDSQALTCRTEAKSVKQKAFTTASVIFGDNGQSRLLRFFNPTASSAHHHYDDSHPSHRHHQQHQHQHLPFRGRVKTLTCGHHRLRRGARTHFCCNRYNRSVCFQAQ